MPFLQKASTTFVKGLITEAGELTFPEDASVDELNCALYRDGSRGKRLAIEFEDGYSLTNEQFSEGLVVQTGTWHNPGGASGLEYLVVQVGPTLIFYNKGISPTSAQRVTISDASATLYTVNLTTFQSPASIGAGSFPVQMTTVNGSLVVVSKGINPFYIERNPDDGTFTETEISFRIRDYEWQGDRSTYDTGLTNASVQDNRKYDTQNVGWVGTKGAAALTTYTGSEGEYPPLTLPWYSGKDASGNFSVSEWQKIFAGTSLAVNGHYILDLFDMDRQTASSLTGVTNTTETSRFQTVATYANRVFYSGLSSTKKGSNIYFSQLLETIDYIGDCYQINDPTSEELSDLLDTDGGYIRIPEAYDIKKLYPVGSKLLVLASNGIWLIGGVDDVFRATEYSVTKISNSGILSTGSFISANGRPYWWSSVGIHTIQEDERGVIREVSISESSIQTFWDNISPTAKLNVIGEYDAIQRKLFWLYPSTTETNEYKMNEVLIFDETLGAFYPWRVSDVSGDTPYIIGTSFYNGSSLSEIEYTVIDSSGNIVVDSLGNTVVSTQLGQSFTGDTSIKFVVYDQASSKITIATFSNTSFYDWGSEDYSTYAEAGYSFMGDMTTKKVQPYITTYLRTTETGWVGSEETGYNPVRESSCKVSSYWDFKDTPSSSAQEAYRLKPTPIVDTGDLDTFGYPQSVVVSRLKMRGRGRSVKLRFEGSPGKDFRLLGWEVVVEKNGRF